MSRGDRPGQRVPRYWAHMPVAHQGGFASNDVNTWIGRLNKAYLLWRLPFIIWVACNPPVEGLNWTKTLSKRKPLQPDNLSWFSGLWTGARTYTVVSPGSPACWGHVLELLSHQSHMSQFPVISHADVDTEGSPIHSVPLEKPAWPDFKKDKLQGLLGVDRSNNMRTASWPLDLATWKSLVMSWAILEEWSLNGMCSRMNKGIGKKRI